MNNTKNNLMDGVKAAVAKYGISGLTTRTLGSITGINDGLIYHYFKDKDALILESYEKSNAELFSAVMGYLKEAQSVPLPFRSRCRLFFHRVWQELLADGDRLLFTDRFRHSARAEDEKELHERQLAMLQTELRNFTGADVSVGVIYAVEAIIYDHAVRVVSGQLPGTTETEELIFSLFYGMLKPAAESPPGRRTVKNVRIRCI